jgi:hypothetical protein
MTSTGFASRMKTIDGVTKAYRSKGPFYTLNYVIIKESLQKNHEFDDEITFE